MKYEETGRLIKGLGGLYEVLLDQGNTPASGGRIEARAKGNFRHEGTQPLVGDRVRVQYDDTAVSHTVSEDTAKNKDGGGAVIAEILPRKNALVRPAVANVDQALVIFADGKP